MANPYSKYTGSKISPVPAGYLAAAQKSAEGVRKSGERFGDMIGAGIAKYYEGKKEDADKDRLADLASSLARHDYQTNEEMSVPLTEESLFILGEDVERTGGDRDKAVLGIPDWSSVTPDAEAAVLKSVEAHEAAVEAQENWKPDPAELAALAKSKEPRSLEDKHARLNESLQQFLGEREKMSPELLREGLAMYQSEMKLVTEQHNADRLHKLRVATEGRLGMPTLPTAPTDIQKQTLLKMKHDLEQAKNAAPPPGESARKMTEWKLDIAKKQADIAKVEESLLTPEQKVALKEKAAADLARVQASTEKTDNENILLGKQIEQIGVDATVQKRVGTATDIIDMPGFKFVWTSKYGGQVEDASGAVKGELTPVEEKGVRDSITRNTTQLTNLFRTLTVINVGEGKVVVDYTKMSDAEAAIANQYQAQIIALKKMLPRFEGSNLLRATELIDFQATKKNGGTEAVYWLPDGASALPDTSGGASTGPAAGQGAIDASKERNRKLQKAAGGDN